MEAFRNARPIFGGLLTTLQAGNGSAHLLTDDDLRTEREPVKEPAKAWRNWWRLYWPTYVRCEACGVFHFRGRAQGEAVDYDGCCTVYPSRDTAESDARATENYDESCERAKVEYLGAYPEGERP